MYTHINILRRNQTIWRFGRGESRGTVRRISSVPRQTFVSRYSQRLSLRIFHSIGSMCCVTLCWSKRHLCAIFEWTETWGYIWPLFEIWFDTMSRWVLTFFCFFFSYFLAFANNIVQLLCLNQKQRISFRSFDVVVSEKQLLFGFWQKLPRYELDPWFTCYWLDWFLNLSTVYTVWIFCWGGKKIKQKCWYGRKSLWTF